VLVFQGISRFDAIVTPSSPIICRELYLARHSEYPLHSIRVDNRQFGNCTTASFRSKRRQDAAARQARNCDMARGYWRTASATHRLKFSVFEQKALSSPDDGVSGEAGYPYA
jgi:hypothetical protein